MGRNSSPRPAEEHCDPVLAGAGVISTGGKTGVSWAAVERLLSRPDVAGWTALCGRSDEWRCGQSHPGGTTAHSWRRSLYVGRICVAGEHRFAHLAESGGNCRPIVVTAGNAGREFDVREDGGTWAT